MQTQLNQKHAVAVCILVLRETYKPAGALEVLGRESSSSSVVRRPLWKRLVLLKPEGGAWQGIHEHRQQQQQQLQGGAPIFRGDARGDARGDLGGDESNMVSSRSRQPVGVQQEVVGF